MTFNVIGVPIGTRLQRIIRIDHAWQIWIATNDFKYGTYLLLYDHGSMWSVTEREGEGPESYQVKGADINNG